MLCKDAILTGLDGLSDRDLTTGTGSAATTSFIGFSWGFSVSLAFFLEPFSGLSIGFSITSIFFSGPFPSNFFGFASGLF